MSASAHAYPGGPGGRVERGALLPIGRARELSAQSLEYLGEVLHNEKKITKHRLTAARAILGYHQWREDYEIGRATPDVTLGELAGSEERLLEWMQRTMPMLEARVAAKARPMIEAKVVDDDREGRRDASGW